MDSTAYERHKQRAAELQRRKSAAGRDIGELPKVVDAKRKAKCKKNFKLFCETYFPNIFNIAWSKDHLRVIKMIQKSVIEGGLFSIAMPRGSGKTSLCEVACVWAMLYGHRKFVMMVGATSAAATDNIRTIKSYFEENGLLLEDFPEVCFPIRELEGRSQRTKGQTYQGKRTKITWTKDTVILPIVGGSKGSGSIIKVAGIKGQIRGKKLDRINEKGELESVRPDLVVADDPQTKDSAKSETQTNEREEILKGDVLGLAGPGNKIAAFIPVTVIEVDDLADRILDHESNPEFCGERTKLIYKFPTNEKLWEEYAELRKQSFREFKDNRLATEFYRKNRKAMDAGAKVAWPERFEENQISAIQYAMDLKFRDERAFFAEYQNDPERVIPEENRQLTVNEVTAKANNFNAGMIPETCDKFTGFIDVHKNLLYYMLVGWDLDYGGHIVDYGTYPEQPRQYFKLSDKKLITLSDEFAGHSPEGQIYEGLNALVNKLVGYEWPRADLALFKPERILIDANWGEMRDVVYKFCRESQHSTLIHPSHGKYIGASGNPIGDWAKKKGDIVKHNCKIPRVDGRNRIRHVIVDTNYWKSFVVNRLLLSKGDKGTITIFGDPERHKLLAEHFTAELKVPTSGKGRDIEEWKTKSSKPDNHWFDCLVGSAVAANIQGLFPNREKDRTVKPKRKKMSLTEQRRRMRR